MDLGAEGSVWGKSQYTEVSRIYASEEWKESQGHIG